MMDPGQPGGPAVNNSSDFVRKLYKMLENPVDESVVRWGNEGTSFVVLENEKFTKHILPKHFKHSNFASFVRQLNKYDFHKVRHNNEENAQSIYGAGAWEFKHPDFRANDEEALDNIRRKAPAPKKPNIAVDDAAMSAQQMELMIAQLGATQQQVQHLQERYNDLSGYHTIVMNEINGIQKRMVNHEHVMHSIMNFLHDVDSQRRQLINQKPQDGQSSIREDPATPLQLASKLLGEAAADMSTTSRNLEAVNELSVRMNGPTTTPPPDMNAKSNIKGGSRAASSTYAVNSLIVGEPEPTVYPMGVTNGIDPTYGEHVNNIPYSLPEKPIGPSDPRNIPKGPGKVNDHDTPGWIRPPRILLVEDDPTCRRIGRKFLLSFQCSVDSALDGSEAVNKMSQGSAYDLVLMDIIMPQLDGISACHIIRHFETATPIIAMTSNIRVDDIQMYFSHGMDDVLPKPFTKDGLVQILNKHLGHLKNPSTPLEDMGPPSSQTLQTANSQNPARTVIKEEDSPAKSPAAGSNWSSPKQLAGISPVAPTNSGDEFMSPHSTPGYNMGGGIIPPVPYPNSAQMPGAGQRLLAPHRRQYSDISGAEDVGNPIKRQQMYLTPSQQQQQQPPMSTVQIRR